jgi:predicted secreted protein
MKMHFSMRVALVAGFAAQAAAPVLADPGRSGKAAKDPNQVICEKQEVLGSRLAVRRVCMTRSQWAEQRRTDSDLVQKSQLNTRQKNP